MPGYTEEKTERTLFQKIRYAILTVIGVLGELLITAAFVVGMFAVWQLFWTTFEVEAGRDQQVAAFEKTLPDAPKTVSNDIRTDPPPPIGDVAHGAVFATMYVPRWHMMQIPVAQGVDQYILDQAFAGHYVGQYPTAMPGELGNFSVAAHRRSYGNSFRRINTIQPGDPIVVETKDAYLVFHATDHQIVLPSQSDVIAPVPGDWHASPTERLMTMTTCDPEWGNSHRYIQHLKFSHWVPRESGIPVELTKELN
ncbi:hypothetical protein BK816_00085 [Boudabousia tangfeifanii]|uniref:Class E sortase n=1 Tax=Boudabousia tangfeifanii TaxID=1912795 RepID=A0A1D9MLZ3_9ACTO|nr:hypothetical protein BK816_00085 [Boudabousia tangfeifanii]